MIGNTIKELRIKKGFNQMNFALRLDVTQTHLSQVEGGKKNPSLKMIKDVADLFFIPWEGLVILSLEESGIVMDKKEEFKVIKPMIEKLIMGIFDLHEVAEKKKIKIKWIG